jgi:hypothetical protein
MRLIKHVLISTIMATGIYGCDKKTLDCSDQAIANTLSDSVKAEISTTLTNLGSSRVGGPVSSPQEIESALATLEPTLLSTRTTRFDKDTNKSYCTGKLSFKVSDAEVQAARKGVNLNNPDSAKNLLLTGMWLTGSNGDWNVYAAKSGLKISDNIFGQDVTYTAQPTDDGKQVYVEFTPTTQIQNFLSQLTSAAIIGSRPPPTDRQTQVPPVSTADEPEDDAPLSRCAQKKLEDYKKSQGEDALVMNDSYTEWERQCKAGE